jgi:hypothetical protein
MATLDNLANRKPPALHRIDVPLDRGEQPERLIYGLPELIDWMAIKLPLLEPGRLKAADAPSEQLDYALYRWISGGDVAYGRMFKDLMPMRDEVWELKTADLRIFGWMYRPRVFIGVFGDYADLYKGRNTSASYAKAIERVKVAREKLEIDQPKIASGKFDDLVCV